MKKTTATLLFIVLSFSLFAANVSAAPSFDKGDRGNSETFETQKESNEELHSSNQNIENTTTEANNANDQVLAEETVEAAKDTEEAEFDGDTKGTDDAENAEDTEGTESAEDTDDTEREKADTEERSKKSELKAYADTLRDAIKQEKKDLETSIEALSDIASIYEEAGFLEDAAEMQREAVLADIENIDSYKKLSKIYEKMGQRGVKAFVNGKQPEFDQPPIIMDGRTLVPVRAIAKSLNAEVHYNSEEQTVTVTKDGAEIKLIIGSTTAYINGEEVTLDIEPIVVNGRTIIPVRFISEALDSVVEWDEETQTVIIYAESSNDAGTQDEVIQ